MVAGCILGTAEWLSIILWWKTHIFWKLGFSLRYKLNRHDIHSWLPGLNFTTRFHLSCYKLQVEVSWFGTMVLQCWEGGSVNHIAVLCSSWNIGNCGLLYLESDTEATGSLFPYNALLYSSSSLSIYGLRLCAIVGKNQGASSVPNRGSCSPPIKGWDSHYGGLVSCAGWYWGGQIFNWVLVKWA